MKYPIHKSILFYTLYSNNSQPQSAIITKFFDGVEEFEKVGGGCVVEGLKHTIFFKHIIFSNILFLPLISNILYFSNIHRGGV